MPRTNYGNTSNVANIIAMKYSTKDSVPISETKSVISAPDCITCDTPNFHIAPLQCQTCILRQQYGRLHDM